MVDRKNVPSKVERKCGCPGLGARVVTGSGITGWMPVPAAPKRYSSVVPFIAARVAASISA